VAFSAGGDGGGTSPKLLRNRRLIVAQADDIPSPLISVKPAPRRRVTASDTFRALSIKRDQFCFRLSSCRDCMAEFIMCCAFGGDPAAKLGQFTL
jgi:hypothetical protein